MNLNRLVGLVVAALLAVGFLGQSARGGSATIAFDPLGAGSTANTINEWDLANTNGVGANSIASTSTLSGINQTGPAFPTLLQGLGLAFQGPSPPGSANSFTAVANFQEIPKVIAAGSPPINTLSFTIPGGTATLNNTNGTATISGTGNGSFQWNKIVPGTTSMALGTGFSPGVTTVATGTWFNIAGTSSSFTGTGLGTLGGTGAAFGTGTPSLVGSGSETFGVLISNPNPAFFPNIPAGDQLLAVLTTTVTTPFGGSTQTSGAFFNGHITTFGNNSGVNGGNGTDTSGDFLFQSTNPAITFYLVTPATTTQTTIPEPSTMLLCAVGLGSLGLVRRLRRRRSA